MDSWEWNKIAGAVLGVLLFVLVIKFVAQAVFNTPQPEKPGYAVAVPEETGRSATALTASEPLPDFHAVLTGADAGHGKDVATRCQQCHDETKAGPNKIGPNLWGIIGRARATHPSYTYSSAMKASHDPWTYESLFVFLKSPQTVIPGTKMSYAGLRSIKDRTDLLAYLRTLDDTPAPLPPAKK